MDATLQAELTAFLAGYITEHKKQLMEQVLAQRTRFITVALEDIYQPQNASAVVRTADCFGIQDIHIIEGRNQYNINPQVVRGSEKWVNLIKYHGQENNTATCFAALRQKGYTLVGTSPHRQGVALPDLQPDRPLALVFGTEETGLSDFALEQVDIHLRIPMYGFTESFNLSVSAAICLYQLTTRLRQSGIDYLLSEEEKAALRLQWYRRVVRRSAVLEEEFLKNKQAK